MADFHKPARVPGSAFDNVRGGVDPAEANRIAHETATALLARVRADPQPDVVDRLVEYTDDNGIDAIAELWSHAAPHSLPGALWRIYLLRLVITRDPDQTSHLFQRGAEAMSTIDPVVAGARTPTGPAEITELADRILRGLFQGDFAGALERAAAFCRVIGTGCTTLADEADLMHPERASELTTRGARYAKTAGELDVCARLWRENALD
jgi:hypothetical protein